MAAFLADENMPIEAVEAARHSGLDVTRIKEIAPGLDDESILAMALTEGRVLVSFDKDFGDLVYQRGINASPGVVLLRPRLRSPESVAQFTVSVLQQKIDWEGNFCVAREGQLRVVPLPL